MIRLLFFIIKIVVIVGIAVWVADHAGKVSIEWQSSIVETSTALLVAAVVLLMWASYTAAQAITTAKSIPRSMRLRRQLRLQGKGQKLIAEALIAFAADKKDKGVSFLRRAERLLGPSQVVDFVRSQMGSGSGMVPAASGMDFGSPYAWKQIVETHMREERLAEALQVARLFGRKYPNLPLPRRMLFDVQVRRRDFESALSIFEELHGALPRKEWRHVKAALLTARGRDALQKNQAAQAFDFARQADRLHPNWVPAILLAAEALAAEEKPNEASSLIERSWASAAHEQLGDLYLSLKTKKTVLQRAQSAEKMARKSPNNPASNLLQARALMHAGLWGQARHYASTLIKEHPHRDIFELMARIEEAENRDVMAAQDWRRKGSEAAPDEAWICENCKQPHGGWQPTCASCKSFNTLGWGTPLHKGLIEGLGARG